MGAIIDIYDDDDDNDDSSNQQQQQQQRSVRTLHEWLRASTPTWATTFGKQKSENVPRCHKGLPVHHLRLAVEVE